MQKNLTFLLAATWVSGFCLLAYSTRPAPQPLHASEASLPIPAIAQTRVNEEQMVDFIVRFNDGVEAVDACLERPRNEFGAAQEIFSAWAETVPALRDMELKKIKYSGEMLLTWHTGATHPISRAKLDAKLDSIKAMPSVRYADPDYTFQPQGSPQ